MRIYRTVMRNFEQTSKRFAQHLRSVRNVSPSIVGPFLQISTKQDRIIVQDNSGIVLVSRCSSASAVKPETTIKSGVERTNSAAEAF